MSESVGSALPLHYRPQVSDDALHWRLPPSFRENEGLAVLGLLQSGLATPELTRCEIDLSEVEWADPLLCLGLVLAESKLRPEQIVVDLGSGVDPASIPRTSDLRSFQAAFEVSR